MTTFQTTLAPLLAGPALVDALIAKLTGWIAEAAQCQRARLYLVDRARNELHCRVSNHPEAYELRLPISVGVHGQVLKSQTAQTTRSSETGEELYVVPVFSPLQGTASGEQVEVIAILDVTGKLDGQGFQGADGATFAAIARDVARVLAHARLDDSRHAPERITEFVGSSAAMLALYPQIESAAASRNPIALIGAHGVGKAHVAKAIHNLGSGKHGPLMHIRCHTEHAFLEPELFGVSGLMPGAIERAAGGTLVIEQLEMCAPATQQQLLDQAAEYNTRIIASLLRPPSAESTADDLIFELAAPLVEATIMVPTLAERGPDDVAMLARHFLRKWSRRLQRPRLEMDAAALARLRAQSWPGNLGELEKCVQSAALACDDNTVEAHHLCLPGSTASSSAADFIPSGLLLADAEERYILRTLSENSQNRTRTATSLGIGRNTLVRKIKQYRNK